jgi:hypothetical protein
MRILVDTGVWLAIFGPTGLTRDRATVTNHAATIQGVTAIIPWPITYETLSSLIARLPSRTHWIPPCDRGVRSILPTACCAWWLMS